MVGTVETVLVTGPSKKNPEKLSARTENNRVVHFTGSADLAGQMVDVKITDVLKFSLLGERVN
jgi:tRNA-2-methylthio-N6-dimethylallyladenosine synthase